MSLLTSGNTMVDAMAEISITGNVIPQKWYKHVLRKNGKPYLLAITILGDIVYWYRPTEIRDEATGHIVGWKKKFRGDLLQKTYKSYANLFGESRASVKAAFDALVSLGVIKRYFKDIVHADGTESNNVMYIELVTEKLRAITFGNEADCGEYQEKNSTPTQKFSGRVGKINDQYTGKEEGEPLKEQGTLPEKIATPMEMFQRTNTYNSSENNPVDYSETTTEITPIDYNHSLTSFIHVCDNPLIDERRIEKDDEHDYYEQLIAKNINMDELLYNHAGNQKLINRMLKVMVDAVSSKSKYMYIAKANRSIQDIRERYLSLRNEHIEHVLKTLPEDDSDISLKDKFLMAYLYNAPDTIGAICKTEQMHLNHNMCTREYDFEEFEKMILNG